MSAPAPATIELRRDVACSACGYNLRGLMTNARCPECSADVATSVARHDLAGSGGEAPIYLSDPAWVRALWTGCALLVAAATWQAALTTISLASGGMFLSGLPVLIRMAPYLLPDFAACLGAWRLTRREAGPARRAAVPRLAGRAGAVASLAATLLFVVIVLWTTNPVQWQWRWAQWVEFAHTVLDAVTAAALFAYLARLAHRLGRMRLRYQAFVLAALLPVTLLCSASWPGRSGYLGYIRVTMGGNEVNYDVTSLHAMGLPGAVPLTAWAVHSLQRGPDHVPWVIASLVTVWAIVLLAWFGLSFRRANAAAGTGGRRGGA